MSVKIRVMPTNWLVLCRFYLRVDRVLVRIYDCRLYAEKGWKHALRECTKREAAYTQLSNHVSRC